MPAPLNLPPGSVRAILALLLVSTLCVPTAMGRAIPPEVAALARLTRAGHEGRAVPGLLLADLNYDVTQPPLAGMDLRDAWDAAPAGVDERTLSSTNRFAPPEAADQFDRRIDHILFVPGTLGASASSAWIVRDEPGGMPPSDHYPVVADIRIRDAC